MVDTRRIDRQSELGRLTAGAPERARRHKRRSERPRSSCNNVELDCLPSIDHTFPDTFPRSGARASGDDLEADAPRAANPPESSRCPRGYCPYPPPAPTTEAGAEPFRELWRRFGSSPEDAAARLVAEHLTFDEKTSLLRGFGWSGYTLHTNHYVGNVRGVPRLGIPPTTMQDAGQGFRTTSSRLVGQVTAFPSALAAGATWDPTMVYRYAAAIGAEFRAKGASVILGPSVNVHRIPRNGRNAEYLSGEDGSLGAPLTAAYVRGMQSRGVAAVAKHFVLNSQETHREYQSSDASDRTLFEVYYPPFQAAVDAGVAAVMCGYNKVNGSYVCGGGPRLIHEHLRRQMGFKGWVMTDWWATHATSAALNGVDQELPGTYPSGRANARAAGGGSHGFFEPSKLRASGADVDGMARRVLSGMLSSGAYDYPEGRPKCTPGIDCSFLLYQAVASGESSSRTAREVAAASTVLLKNDRRLLPLRRGARVALLGSACDAPFLHASEGRWDAGDYYTLGGSGRVISSAHAASTVAAELRLRRDAGEIGELTVSPSDDVDSALNAMGGHDVAIACGGAIAREGTDRTSLRLDQDSFLRSLASRASRARAESPGSATRRPAPLVVLALAPGAIVADWASEAQAALAMFLTGQETGRAFADVLLGDVNPSAKLPVTFPLRESDVPSPCGSSRCAYVERLHVGWKGLIGRPVAFPFGHGLSYTTFDMAWAETPRAAASHEAEDQSAVALELVVEVKNTGDVAGAEVAQLYLRFPASAGEPELVLRDFRKTRLLQPGETQTVRFGLTSRALSVWDEGSGGWRRVAGGFEAVVGPSSRAVALRHAFRG